MSEYFFNPILHNPGNIVSRYKEESRRRSKILKEKLIPAKTSIAYWVANILKTNGERHMRAVSLDYSWFQRYMLDILGLFIGTLLLLITLLKSVITKICKKCCRSKKAKSKSYNSLNSIID